VKKNTQTHHTLQRSSHIACYSIVNRNVYFIISKIGYCVNYGHTVVLVLLISAYSYRQEMALGLRPFPATLG
jgi:hypothetical protein